MTNDLYQPFGPITPVEWEARFTNQGIRMRCFLNGTDVTDRCVFADDELGIVTLNKLRDGRAYLDEAGNVAQETLTGTVRFLRAGAL